MSVCMRTRQAKESLSSDLSTIDIAHIHACTHIFDIFGGTKTFLVLKVIFK